MKLSSHHKGFTLLEILLVVAALAILAGIVIFAINPGKQIADTRDAQRKVDVNTILNAIYQYSIDNGSIPASIPITTANEVCKTGATDCSGLVDLSDLTTNERYLVSIPVDPLGGTDTDGTGYTVLKTANNRVTVAAPKDENSVISATR
jgi:prepilin-type N-terminal cleavage/methylation domain-containing protein